MSERQHDIVERLKIAQANTASIYPVRPKLLQDAIDEIEGLRAFKARVFADVRDAALEEAALACDRRRDMTGEQSAYAVLDVQSYTSACSGCAYDIRALKEKG